MPAIQHAPTCCSRQCPGHGGVVLQAVLGHQGFPGAERPGLVGNGHTLFTTADQGHFDAIVFRLPLGSVDELVGLEVCVQVAIEAMQEVAGEGGRHSRCIVVRRFHDRSWFGVIEAQ